MTRSVSSSAESAPIRVLVAEDSPTVRRVLVEILTSDPGFRVVGEVDNGADAIRQAVALLPDLITMDVQMPHVDGLEATREIMRVAPTSILVVSAAASRGEVDLSMQALDAGALMVVGKPPHPDAPDFEDHRNQLLAMARAMAGVKVVRRWHSNATRDAARTAPPATTTVRAVAFGTSTGGPAALHHILAELPPDFPVPILIVQHIARGFVAGLARWLHANCRLRVTVARPHEALVGGSAYIAPDNRHLGIGPGVTAIVSDEPPIGGFRPAADYLFQSAARSLGAGVVAGVLTGMGRDGVDGLRALHSAGARILAQNEASSAVFGMAAEAVKAGVVHEVLPLNAFAKRLIQLVS